MSQTALELMAQAIMNRLRGTAAGHCARVDYFDRQRANELCDAMEQAAQSNGIALYILTSSTHEHNHQRYITTDRAIGLRNRKAQRLCLFIPSDLVDAAFSSLANSFAPIDGGQIQREAIKHIYDDLSFDGQNAVRAVRRVVKAPLRLSLDRDLAFHAKVAERDQQDQLERVGADLWQVGLIADSGDDWLKRLNRNRTATLQLSLPLKIQSSTVERVDSLHVDLATRTELIRFLQNKAVNNVATWSEDLSKQPEITLDRWIFPREDSSNLVSIMINPFVNAEGIVEKQSNLKQPEGSNGLLYAAYGPKESITVRWKSDPPNPLQLHRWRVELVPANEYVPDEDSEIDLPMREISASRRSLKLNLDMDLAPDELPEYPLCVRLTPLDKSGNIIRVKQDEIVRESAEITAYSQDFYLSNEKTPPKPVTLTSTRRTTPTIAFGRIEALLAATAKQTLNESEPQQNATNTNFSLRVSEHRLINLALSPLLVALEQQSLANPQAQRYTTDVMSMRPLAIADIAPYIVSGITSEAWTTWINARKRFFEAIEHRELRHLVATADWKELAEPARRYGDAYQQLLNDLIERNAAPKILRDVINIDTIHIRVQGQYGLEEAVIALPTHPVRAAWLASYTQLLDHWEKILLPMPPRERKTAIDLDLLRALEPANVPPFLCHPQSAEAVLSVGNLGFFYGVYLPAPFADTERRIADLSLLLGIEQISSLTTNDVLAAQLTRHLQTFQDMHPYIDTLALGLIQTHNAPWVSEALTNMLNRVDRDTEDDVLLPPALALTAYVAQPQTAVSIQGIDSLRQLLNEQSLRRESDYLHPAIASATTALDTLLHDETDPAHLAIISDLARPDIVPIASDTPVSGAHSLSVYGLIVRLIPSFALQETQLRWVNSVALPDTLPQEHPAAPRYGKTLLDLYRAMQRAVGRSIANDPVQWPAVAYNVDQQQEQIIRQTHAHADWVITADRFFALDYYDSPHEPALQQQAQTYVIDYAPEFADGIGRRMFVTTHWRNEVEQLLATAMHELGFAHIDQSVGQLLHYLKTISGQLALRLAQSETSAAAAVGMGVVTAYLKQRGELENAVLIPVDSAPRLVSRTLAEGIKKGERRCDLLLLSMKRNAIDMTFIEVKWRRGTSSFDSLATEMEAQMRLTEESVRERYFSSERADSVLQRAYFANIVRFYIDRAHRYKLLKDDAHKGFMESLRFIERPSYSFNAKQRGFIVTLEKASTPSLQTGESVIEVITASDIAAFAVPAPQSTPSQPAQSQESDDASQPSSVVNDLTPAAPQDDAYQPAIVQHDEPTEIQTNLAQAASVMNIDIEDRELVVTLGDTSKGTVDWKPSVKGSPHLFIIGIPGQGKSVTTSHILIEMARQHVPTLVLDFHGQFGDAQGSYARIAGATT
jgi:DNA phosphorothioation-dependent restriction protein DptH